MSIYPNEKIYTSDGTYSTKLLSICYKKYRHIVKTNYMKHKLVTKLSLNKDIQMLIKEKLPTIPGADEYHCFSNHTSTFCTTCHFHVIKTQ